MIRSGVFNRGSILVPPFKSVSTVIKIYLNPLAVCTFYGRTPGSDFYRYCNYASSLLKSNLCPFLWSCASHLEEAATHNPPKNKTCFKSLGCGRINLWRWRNWEEKGSDNFSLWIIDFFFCTFQNLNRTMLRKESTTIDITWTCISIQKFWLFKKSLFWELIFWN